MVKSAPVLSQPSDVDSFLDSVLLRDSTVWDRQARYPGSVITSLGRAGIFHTETRERVFGRGPAEALGETAARIGSRCSSTRSLLTVQDMVTHLVERWGDRELWPTHEALVKGELCAAFALSEGQSSAKPSLTTRAEAAEGGYLVSGVKRWVTFGAIADLVLVICASDAGPVALMLDTKQQGLSARRVQGLVGMRASMTADLTLTNVYVPSARRIGPAGLGLSLIAGSALERGKLTVAWGAAGLAAACLEEAVRFAQDRATAGGRTLIQEPLIRRRLTRMLAATESAFMWCHRLARACDSGARSLTSLSAMAKYEVTRLAQQVAGDSVHVQGAHGLVSASLSSRFMRDSHVYRLIEGTEEMAELTLADCADRPASYAWGRWQF